jgi:hypothetical protein
MYGVDCKPLPSLASMHRAENGRSFVRSHQYTQQIASMIADLVGSKSKRGPGGTAARYCAIISSARNLVDSVADADAARPIGLAAPRSANLQHCLAISSGFADILWLRYAWPAHIQVRVMANVKIRFSGI